ncbi:hypothetical protein BOW37_11785 [Solemya velum gill symbiont]|nr:hypothetical protein BOW37_11785 [Solemya velum gill symbiont]OOZ44138.1 hypothetical protein BOW38_11865 [Solemya velum gill symbiont]OOZ48087.1 hypothetical protein BOW39_12375 [Solemya velum gill symbiont]OOZ49268.1 hypothetical protein BOW40_11940 [Solemya velum gill symbiont]OOZ53037.1 hypothetical protein BOW41_11965 [Solemya velum gill symbiont]
MIPVFTLDGFDPYNHMINLAKLINEYFLLVLLQETGQTLNSFQDTISNCLNNKYGTLLRHSGYNLETYRMLV